MQLEDYVKLEGFIFYSSIGLFTIHYLRNGNQKTDAYDSMQLSSNKS